MASVKKHQKYKNIDFLTFSQCYEQDLFLTKTCHLSFDQLIERAGWLIYQWILDHYANHSIMAIVGKGNNGKDALVACRYLAAHKIPITVVLLDPSIENHKEFAQIRLISTVSIIRALPDEVNSNTIIIDAIFGFGINKPLTGNYHNFINKINHYSSPIISIDIPSGLRENMDSVCINATHTLTMMHPKVVFLDPAAQSFLGDVYILNFNYPVEYQNGYNCYESTNNYFKIDL